MRKLLLAISTMAALYIPDLAFAQAAKAAPTPPSKTLMAGKDTAQYPAVRPVTVGQDGRLSVHLSRAHGKPGTPVNVSCVSGSSTDSAPLTPGVTYRVKALGDLYYKVGSGSAITDNAMDKGETEYRTPAGTGEAAPVISCITSTGSATLQLTPITPKE